MTLFFLQGYENYVPEWFEQKEDSEIAFKRNLTQLGYEIVQLEPHVQEYYFDNVNTVAGILDLMKQANVRNRK